MSAPQGLGARMGQAAVNAIVGTSPIPSVADGTLAANQLLVIDRLAQKCRKARGLLLFHSMGSGKTRTGLAIALSLSAEYNSVTIVVPKGLDTPWTGEMSKDQPYGLGIGRVEENTNETQVFGQRVVGAPPPNPGLFGNIFPRAPNTEFKFNFVEYDNLLRPESAPLIAGKIVLFDEAHYLLKYFNDLNTQAQLVNLMETAKKRVLLTGTPIQNNYWDLNILISLSQAKFTPTIPIERGSFDRKYLEEGFGVRYMRLAKNVRYWGFTPGALIAVLANVKKVAQGVVALAPAAARLAAEESPVKALALGAIAAAPGAIAAAPGAAVAAIAANPVVAVVGVGLFIFPVLLSIVGADQPSYNFRRIAADDSPYISFFDYHFESPQTKVKFPFIAIKGNESKLGPTITPVPFTFFQQVVLLSQYLNPGADRDIAQMLELLPTAIQGLQTNDQTVVIRQLETALGAIKNTDGIHAFMERMRLIGSISKYNYYYDAVRDDGVFGRALPHRGRESQPISYAALATMMNRTPVENHVFKPQLKPGAAELNNGVDSSSETYVDLNAVNPRIFDCPKFEKAKNIILDMRIHYSYLPVVYSNFKTGFETFSAYLTSQEIPHIVISADDDSATREFLLECANFPWRKDAPPGLPDNERGAVLQRNVAYLNRLLRNIHDFDDGTLTAEEQGRPHVPVGAFRMLHDLSTRWVPKCVVLDPRIKEGYSFKFSPAMVILEMPSGYGVREQIYGRILRQLTVRNGIIEKGVFDRDNENMLQPINEILEAKPYTYDFGLIKGSFDATRGAISPFGIRRKILNAVATVRPTAVDQGSPQETQLVQRVRKYIFQLIGAETNDKITVPKPLRDIGLPLPAKIRLGISVELPGTRVQPNIGENERVIKLGAVSINTQFLKQNARAAWVHAFGSIGNDLKVKKMFEGMQVGPRNVTEYIDSLPVPWMAVTPDDFIDDQNLAQEDQIALMSEDLKQAERTAVCPPGSTTNTNCTVWRSRTNRGTCRIEPLTQAAGRATRRPISLPTRRAGRSSSSSKRNYTHRQRALRTGKGGYRTTKTGRKV
jgi:hypothetical protein